MAEEAFGVITLLENRLQNYTSESENSSTLQVSIL